MAPFYKPLTAADARTLTAAVAVVDNTDAILHRVAAAAKQGESAVEVSDEVMTEATIYRLQELGYMVSSHRRQGQGGWIGVDNYYKVSW